MTKRIISLKLAVILLFAFSGDVSALSPDLAGSLNGVQAEKVYSEAHLTESPTREISDVSQGSVERNAGVIQTGGGQYEPICLTQGQYSVAAVLDRNSRGDDSIWRYYINVDNIVAATNISREEAVTAIQAGVQRWNNVVPGRIKFQYQGTTSLEPRTLAGEPNPDVNIIGFMSRPAGNTSGRAFMDYSGTSLEQVRTQGWDIWLAAEQPFFTGNNVQADALSLESLVAHEIGHVLGLEHVPSTNEIMYAMLPLGATKGLGPGDRAAALELYGPNRIDPCALTNPTPEPVSAAPAPQPTTAPAAAPTETPNVVDNAPGQGNPGFSNPWPHRVTYGGSEPVTTPTDPNVVTTPEPVTPQPSTPTPQPAQQTPGNNAGQSPDRANNPADNQTTDNVAVTPIPTTVLEPVSPTPTVDETVESEQPTPAASGPNETITRDLQPRQQEIDNRVDNSVSLDNMAAPIDYPGSFADVADEIAAKNGWVKPIPITPATDKTGTSQEEVLGVQVSQGGGDSSKPLAIVKAEADAVKKTGVADTNVAESNESTNHDNLAYTGVEQNVALVGLGLIAAGLYSFIGREIAIVGRKE